MLDGRAASVSRMIRPKRADQVPQLDLLDRLAGQVALVARAGRSTAANSAAANCGSRSSRMLAASRYFLYSSSRRTNSCRGSSNSLLHLVAPRQHLLRLDLDQQAGHGQKIAHRVDVQLLDHRQVFEILVGDRRRWEYRRSPPRACAPGRAAGPAGRGTRSGRRESRSRVGRLRWCRVRGQRQIQIYPAEISAVGEQGAEQWLLSSYHDAGPGSYNCLALTTI